MNDEDFPDIKTGNGIDRDLAATSNDRLKKVVIAVRSLESAVAKLEKTFIALDEKNGKLQNRIFWLTMVSAFLAATQIVQVIDVIKDWLSPA